MGRLGGVGVVVRAAPRLTHFQGDETSDYALTSWIPHIVVPGLMALAFLPVARGKAAYLAPMVWVPDLDIFVPGLSHRSILHSIWVPLGFLVALRWMWTNSGVQRFWDYALTPGGPQTLLLMAYYWTSHLILDIFTGGVLLFWPWDRAFYFDLYIQIDTVNKQIEPQVGPGTELGAPPISPLYEWVSFPDGAVLAFCVVCFVFWIGWRLGRGRAAETTPRSEQELSTKGKTGR